MGSIAKPFNRVFFLLCVLITGSLAGAFVWLFFFLMDVGISFLWQTLPGWIGSVTAEPLPVLSQGPFGFVPFPLIVCVLGGLVIGLYAKHTGVEPEDLNSVMAKVKQDGRYDYSHIGKLSLAALLPLLFGGSIGPEAGLTGVIAGLCTWVGDRMRKFGADFRALTVAGTQAALAALFTAPLYGFVAPLSGTADGTRGEENIALPKAQKAVVYLCAIAGALSAFLILGQLFGENSGLPRFDAVEVGSYELMLLLPLALAGMVCGWVFQMQRDGMVLHTWKMDKLYEYYVLYELLSALHGRGFSPNSSLDASPIEQAHYSLDSRYFQNETQVATVFRLVRGDERITLYYQPVIYGDEREEHGISLHRTTLTSAGFDSYWTPDYLIVHESCEGTRTLVLDAKFRKVSALSLIHI